MASPVFSSAKNVFVKGDDLSLSVAKHDENKGNGYTVTSNLLSPMQNGGRLSVICEIEIAGSNHAIFYYKRSIDGRLVDDDSYVFRTPALGPKFKSIYDAMEGGEILKTSVLKAFYEGMLHMFADRKYSPSLLQLGRS